MSMNDSSCFLRTALLGNAGFSAISGICFLLFSHPVSERIGLAQPFLLISTGGLLLIFAAGLVLSARREILDLREAWVAVGLDTCWVVGSLFLLASGLFTPVGNWAVAIVADVVLTFAMLQTIGIVKLTRNGRVATHA